MNSSSSSKPAPDVLGNYPDHSSNSHLKTYTAGEDGSRLAAAAKELGLQKARQPRAQVRRRVAPRFSSTLKHLLLDSTMEDVRMMAIYSSHDRYDDETQRLFHVSLPEEGMLETLAEEEEEEGMVEGHEVVGGDLTSAVLGIIKGMVGPAILYLPHGFASAGYVVALPILVLCTVLFLYSSQCLLSAWKLETVKPLESEGVGLLAGSMTISRRPQRILLSYPELAYRALGPTGESLVKAGIALMQSGVCLTYLIFVPQNLHTSVRILLGWDIAPQLWLLVMVALQVPLSWIRDIRKLTPTNLLANCLILYGLITCLCFAIQAATHDKARPDVGPWQLLGEHWAALTPFANDWFLFIGTSVLLFEGSITLLVPLQEAVQGEEDRAAFPAVYQRVILGIICFYAFFGITCWVAFGNDVKTVLTTSLPEGVLATTVQFAYSIAVIFTFPLQNFPALEIACRTISGMLQHSTAIKPGSLWTRRNVISSILVILLAIVAVCTMESLDKVVSLMGSLLGCPIAFVFPPLIHSRLDPRISRPRLWANRITVCLGFVAMLVASATTLLTW